MKHLYTLKFEKPVKVVKRDSGGVEFTDGTTITHFHDQDCCEDVYADWSSLDDTGFDDTEFTKIVIKGNPLVGIVLNEFAVNCYNSQNGYYSDELKLIINTSNKDTIKIDITEFETEDIC